MAGLHRNLVGASRIADRLSDIAGGVAFVMVAAAVGIVNHMILVRMLGEAVVWHMELSVFLVVGAFFLAVPYAVKVKGHVGVFLIFSILAPRAANILQTCIHLFVFIVVAYLVIGGTEEALRAYRTDLHSNSLWGPPLWPVYALMPVGFLLTCLQLGSEVIKLRMNPDSAALP